MFDDDTLDDTLPGDDQPDLNPDDLNLAESAPMHLDAGVFDGLLDYAVSDGAHDVDDSIVPDDAPADAAVDDDLDAIALPEDAADPLDTADPLDDAHADPASLPDPHAGDDTEFGTGGDAGDVIPDDLPGLDGFDGASVFEGNDGGAVDGGDADASSSTTDLDW